ncbi:ribonuclease H-like domain-containing protein [Thelephora terrestris]|uniref:RNA exonuclease 4 n=1 Tax=Thelephora terrestris TaxID=56493 RepID=A0A9P6HCH3_9AGAM|nr:ribonuclease H-like domain-containing protein [Thelephora terrestris]
MGAKLNLQPSANWLALQKKITPHSPHPRKKRKLDHEAAPDQHPKRGESSSSSLCAQKTPKSAPGLFTGVKNGESIDALRKMILGESEEQYTELQKQSGKYIALDCEMVGVGAEGKESSLARVSIVNYHGVVLLDEIVKQRERVVDYRTEWSGIRPGDLINAKPFTEVQKQVAVLLKDKILVGHAVFNDLKALLLSHPFPLTRDTQQLAYKYTLSKGRHPALRNLTAQEFGIQIQGGEHSSVTDARATMAIYRLHRREWEKGKTHQLPSDPSRTPRKRKRSVGEVDNDPPGGGEKGISTGLATIVKRLNPPKTKNTSSTASKKRAEWWSELGSSKGSQRA